MSNALKRGRTAEKAFPRARSRSRSMSIARPARLVIPRAIYNGEYKMTRIANGTLPSASGIGFTIGGSSLPGFFITVSPVGVTLWQNSLTYINYDFPNSAEVAALFDQTRIDKLEIEFSGGGSDQAPGVGVMMPRIYVAADYTDGTTGTTLAQVLQQQGAKWLNCSNDNSIQKFTIYPKFQRQIYYTSLTTGYESSSGFIQSGIDVPHYGCRVACDAAKLASSGLQMSFKVFMTCKHVK